MVERNELLRMNSNVHPYGPPITEDGARGVHDRISFAIEFNRKYEELEANQGCVGRIEDISKSFNPRFR